MDLAQTIIAAVTSVAAMVALFYAYRAARSAGDTVHLGRDSLKKLAASLC